MIVKNESKIIERALHSIFPYIDSYCICDTGSTDNTIELIKQFFDTQEIKKPGKVVEKPFKDFGYNRTFSLNQCVDIDPDASQYVLLIDADMKFECHLDPVTFRSKLSKDAYYIFQGSPGFYYKNVRIVRNRKGFTYWGVTHEYIKNPPDGAQYEQYEVSECFINDIGDGGCKIDKFERDIALLKKGIEDNPDNDRYTFYLANSYMNSEKYTEAIQFYDKRVALGGWIEEVWHSHYSAAMCHHHLGNHEHAISRWMDAFQAFPDRMENIYEIVKYYRCKGSHVLGYFFYKLAVDIRHANLYQTDFLFWQKDVYAYKLDYEMSIIGYYHNPEKINMSTLSMQLFRHFLPDRSMYSSIFSNYKFYSDKLLNHAVHHHCVVDFVDKEHVVDLISSTPTMCWGDNTQKKLIMGVRYVNYSIDERGNYINKDNIITMTSFSEVNPDISKGLQKFGKPVIMSHNTADDGRYIGPEDVRIIRTEDGRILYNANRCFDSGECKVEHGQITSLQYSCKNTCILSKDTGMERCEKNWTLFTLPHDKTNQIYCVYDWGKFNVGRLTNNAYNGGVGFVTFSQQEGLPSFFKDVRGSTNGTVIGDEIWFLCHTVSYEDRRYYYHLMIVFNIRTMSLSRYSPLFTFEGEKVEYTLGFVHKQVEDTILIGYSKYDKETHLMEINRSWFNQRMISI